MKVRKKDTQKIIVFDIQNKKKNNNKQSEKPINIIHSQLNTYLRLVGQIYM